MTDKWKKVRAKKAFWLFGKKARQVEILQRLDLAETRIMIGDELRLKLGQGAQYLHGKEWEGVGYVKDLIDGEVGI